MSEQLQERDVAELEAELQSDPQNIDLKIELADAVAYRYVHGEGDEEDFDRAREIIEAVPAGQGRNVRAFIRFHEGKREEALGCLISLVREHFCEADEPPSCDKTCDLMMWTIGFDDDFVRKVLDRAADEIAKRWADCAAVHYLRGLDAADSQSDPNTALELFVRALEVDPTYWSAAMACAAIYVERKIWRSAAPYYRQALKSEGYRSDADSCFEAAWCFGKIGSYTEELDAYRCCLGIDSGYPYARNNLGWALTRLGRTDEAIEVFRECLRDGKDGKYPLRNLARALRKLGRYSEAIEVLQKDTFRGQLTKFAAQNIEEMEKLIESGDATPPRENENEEDESDFEPFSGADEEEQAKEDQTEVQREQAKRPSSISQRRSEKQPQRKAPLPREALLEELIEEQIRRGKKVFARRMEIFECADGRYGRQLIIPDVGRLDLLAQDLESGELIVIELKRDVGDREVVGQILGYMGWVSQHLTKPEQNVVGVICVHRASKALRFAAEQANLEVHLFDLTFERV